MNAACTELAGPDKCIGGTLTLLNGEDPELAPSSENNCLHSFGKGRHLQEIYEHHADAPGG